MYLVVVDGTVLQGEYGRPLRFESANEAEQMLERHRELFGIRRSPAPLHHTPLTCGDAAHHRVSGRVSGVTEACQGRSGS
ncbi:hypothetical protein [Streptacidiphilus sp. BW17]|uniref:hypothetical protein n=1 Tax=Streptacidiphilus sp. BW17 TaxID=3156274 RepID=UPI00351998FD